MWVYWRMMAVRAVLSARHSCVILSFLYQLFSDYHSIIILSDQLSLDY